MNKTIFFMLLAIAFSLASKQEAVGSRAERGTQKERKALVQVVSSAHEIEAIRGLLVLEIFADWCPSCVRMMPVFEEVARYFKRTRGKITFAKMKLESFDETDSTVKIMQDLFGFRVTLIPSFLVIHDGEIIQAMRGSQSKQELIDTLTDQLG
jgi:thiol-disulfide isomerase/thioredoxin